MPTSSGFFRSHLCRLLFWHYQTAQTGKFCSDSHRGLAPPAHAHAITKLETSSYNPTASQKSSWGQLWCWVKQSGATDGRDAPQMRDSPSPGAQHGQGGSSPLDWMGHFSLSRQPTAYNVQQKRSQGCPPLPAAPVQQVEMDSHCKSLPPFAVCAAQELNHFTVSPFTCR